MYVLAKVHKKGRLYDRFFDCLVTHTKHLIKVLAYYFKKIEVANIETKKKMASEVLEKTLLDSDGSINSLDLKTFNKLSTKRRFRNSTRKSVKQATRPQLHGKTIKNLQKWR